MEQGKKGFWKKVGKVLAPKKARESKSLGGLPDALEPTPTVDEKSMLSVAQDLPDKDMSNSNEPRAEASIQSYKPTEHEAAAKAGHLQEHNTIEATESSMAAAPAEETTTACEAAAEIVNSGLDPVTEEVALEVAPAETDDKDDNTEDRSGQLHKSVSEPPTTETVITSENANASDSTKPKETIQDTADAREPCNKEGVQSLSPVAPQTANVPTAIPANELQTCTLKGTKAEVASKITLLSHQSDCSNLTTFSKVKQPLATAVSLGFNGRTGIQDNAHSKGAKQRSLMTQGEVNIESYELDKYPDVKRVRNELETARLQRQIFQLEAELKAERDSKDETIASVDKFKTRIRTLKMNIDSQQAKHDAQVAQLNTDVEAAHAEAAAAKAENVTLASRCTALQTQLEQNIAEQTSALHKEVQERTGKEQSLVTELEAARNACKKAEVALSDAHQKQAELEKQLKELVDASESDKGSLQQALSSLKTRTSDLEATEKLLSEAHNHHKELDKELQAARGDAKQAKEQLDAALKLAEQESARAKQLETQVQELASQVELSSAEKPGKET